MNTKSFGVRVHTYTKCQAIAITKCQMSIAMRKYIAEQTDFLMKNVLNFSMVPVLLYDYYSNSQFINCWFGNFRERLFGQLYLIRANTRTAHKMCATKWGNVFFELHPFCIGFKSEFKFDKRTANYNWCCWRLSLSVCVFCIRIGVVKSYSKWKYIFKYFAINEFEIHVFQLNSNCRWSVWWNICFDNIKFASIR